MRNLGTATLLGMFLCALGFAQGTFVVTGTPIPKDLLEQNYGRVPKGIGAYDLSICNSTGTRQSVTSSEIYQALSECDKGLQPVGRQIMLAAILRNQNRNVANILSLALNSAAGVLSVLSSSKYSVPTGILTGTAVGSLSVQQLLSNLRPILSVDQVEKFESQVLEPALVLDGGSCVERTVFVASESSRSKPQGLRFHVR
jgi:hypothetical protein